MVFSYRAIGPGRDIVKGEVAAVDETDAFRKIQALALLPIDVRAKGKKGLPGFLSSARPRRVKKEDLMVAFRELAVMLRAGIPILRTLRIIIESNENQPLGAAFEKVYEDVKRGESLAAAMERRPEAFSHIIVNMVRTGERSGRLAEVLLSVSRDLEHAVLVAAEIRNALAYPAFILTMSLFALLFIFTTVVPKFNAIISQLNVELPAYSRFVLAFGTMLRRRFLFVAAAAVLLLFAAVRLARREKVRVALGRLWLRTPILKSVIIQVELSRFAHALAVLLESGVEIIQSLRMATAAMGNPYLRKVFSGVADPLKRGESLHLSLRNLKVFPGLAVHMIEVGEETGKLSEILEEISTLFVEKFRTTMKRFISLLEPVVITVVGVIIGFIVISLVSAIMSLNDIRF